ncbi:hypothetical protein AB1Y20_014509 [Prymnesium parvum]|uniref:Uncharacterized protein n=1 Tax=Prymnesium parvum TaxID=97485 RepID=A0AB34IAW5_PRYPA
MQPCAARHARTQQSNTADRPRPERQWTATTLAASARSHAWIEAHASRSIISGGQRNPVKRSCTTRPPKGEGS